MNRELILFSQEPASVAPGETLPPLGEVELVRARIENVLPGVRWTEEGRGVLEGPGWTMTFDHARFGEVENIVLHVEGSGGDPLASVLRLCKETGWAALDAVAGHLVSTPTRPVRARVERKREGGGGETSGGGASASAQGAGRSPAPAGTASVRVEPARVATAVPSADLWLNLGISGVFFALIVRLLWYRGPRGRRLA